jgi:MoaA/NifB/PqqE/SkfB family radical SAM enzyme
MHVARIVTNETCNHRCRFCDARRDHERRSIAGAPAVRARIDAALAGGATELVLTGGEPTLRADLPRVVAYARHHGAARIVLETNGRRIDAASAEALARAGLHVARVHLPAWGAALDAITGDPGGAAATERGLAALAAAGIACEATAPVVRDNLASLPELPGHLVGHVDTLWLRPVWRAPDADAVADVADVAHCVERVAAAARGVGLTVRLDAATWIPPCAFDRPSRIAHLFGLNVGAAARPDHDRPAACGDCRVQDRCAGVPHGVAAFDDFVPRPIDDDRLRRRLTVIRTVADQVDRELVTHESYRRDDGTSVPAAIIRIRFACNQACRFCFVSTHLPHPDAARVEAAIDDIAARGGIAVLSGGEPTLDPELPRYVRRAKARGAREVELQTNATQLTDPARAQELAEAGVDIAFVSLHGATANVGDRVTDAPGTFVQTCLGLDHLLAAGIAVRINYVLCALNHAEFPAFVDLVATRWPAAAVTVSFVGMSTDLVPRHPDLVPRYRDVAGPLSEGLRRAAAHGLLVEGFDSMCGLPACLVPGDISRFFDLPEVPDGYDGGEFVHPAPCRTCVLKTRCFGLRRSYAEMYGDDELSPITADPRTP